MKSALFLLLCFIMFDCSQGLKCYKLYRQHWTKGGFDDYKEEICRADQKYCWGAGRMMACLYGDCPEDYKVKQKCERGEKYCCCTTDMCNPPLGQRCYMQHHAGDSFPRPAMITHAFGWYGWCENYCESNGYERQCNWPKSKCPEEIIKQKCEGVERCCCNTPMCNIPLGPEYFIECYDGYSKDIEKMKDCVSCDVGYYDWRCSNGYDCGTTSRSLADKCDMDAGATDWKGTRIRCCCRTNLCNKPKPHVTTQSTTQMTMQGQKRLSQATTLLAGLVMLILKTFF